MPFRFKLPHSRWNGLPEDALTQRGYQVLARAADGSVDTFVKKYNSLFVYFQGHPEYEPDTLLLEYRRDVGRYLRGESGVYPQLPDGYLDQETAVTLTAMQQEATQRPHPELFPEICRILAGIKIENNWGAGAQRIYANWIEYLRAQKQRDLGHANIGTLNGASNRSKLVAVASGTHRPHVFARGRKGAVTHAKPSQSAAISQ
jgi:homoserine O-succinyltransferase